jgi:gamma-glutamylcyclotransferase (GGCT)/AIG2-like uncharacterized protein YtfP
MYIGGFVSLNMTMSPPMTTTAAILLFSYGTLQDKKDSIPGYRQTLLEIADPQVIATSGKTHHPIVAPSPDPTDEVSGSVFEITPQELAAADQYEVSDYERVSVKLKSGVEAWVYVRA